MKTLNRYTGIGYALVIAFYAGLWVWASNRTNRTEPGEGEEPLTALLPDTLVRDIHTIMDWDPVLDESKEDTLVNRPSRYAPKNIDGSEPQDIAYLLRSTLFSHFSKRFNAEPAELERLAAVDFTSGGTLPVRNGCILSLVNDVDVTRNLTLLEFAQDIVDDSLYLDRQGGTNFVAVATIEYADRDSTAFPVRLTFRKGLAEGASVWYMTEAESPYFTCGEPDKPFFMDATEHELMFIGMSRHPRRSAESLAGPDFKPDGRTAFLSLVSSGSIAYSRSIGTAYVAWLGDYTLLIEHVESWVHQRSGLLITRLMKGSELLFENRPVSPS